MFICCGETYKQKKIGTKDILLKLLYADDVAVVADGEANLLEQLIEWIDTNYVLKTWTNSKFGED